MTATEDPGLDVVETRDFMLLSPIRLSVESLDLVPLDLTPCNGGVVSEIFFVLVLALMEDRLEMPLLLVVPVEVNLPRVFVDFDCGFKRGIVLLLPAEEAVVVLDGSDLCALERSGGVVAADKVPATITCRGRLVPVLLVFLSAVEDSDACLLRGGLGGRDAVNAPPIMCGSLFVFDINFEFFGDGIFVIVLEIFGLLSFSTFFFCFSFSLAASCSAACSRKVSISILDSRECNGVASNTFTSIEAREGG